MSTTFQAHKNFASTSVVTVPTPAASGTTLVVADGTFGGGSPAVSVPFNVVIWPANATPTPDNAEVVTVTAISVNTLTITRLQESSTARAIQVGDIVSLTITKKAINDIETAINTLETTVFTPASDQTILATQVFS